MTHWFVTSPTYPYHEVVLEDGSGPTYDVNDYAEIDAPTRREAIVAAVKEWLAERQDNWAHSRRSDGLNPFAGVKAVSVEEAKAEARDSGPPDWTPDYCDVCKPAHDGATRWVWNDDELEWGWFGACVAVPTPGDPK